MVATVYPVIVMVAEVPDVVARIVAPSKVTCGLVCCEKSVPPAVMTKPPELRSLPVAGRNSKTALLLTAIRY